MEGSGINSSLNSGRFILKTSHLNRFQPVGGRLHQSTSFQDTESAVTGSGIVVTKASRYQQVVQHGHQLSLIVVKKSDWPVLSVAD